MNGFPRSKDVFLLCLEEKAKKVIINTNELREPQTILFKKQRVFFKTVLEEQ
jgi:hypothetical protein